MEAKVVGQVVTKSAYGNCSESACDCAAVTSLAVRRMESEDQQALCLNHFLERCYAGLESVDPRGQKFRKNPVDLPCMRAFVEECSRKALDVSLQSEDLSNLERGRLLDILLWAGELFLLLRAPRIILTEPVASAEPLAASRAASPRL